MWCFLSLLNCSQDQCINATGDGRRHVHLRDDRPRLPERVPQEEVRLGAQGDPDPEAGGQQMLRQGVVNGRVIVLDNLSRYSWE